MQEVLILLVALFFGFLFSRFLYFIYEYSEGKTEKVEKFTTPKGYHVHHSMYGVTSLFIIPFTAGHHVMTTIFLLGFGIGIILEHTIEEGFVFISKWNDEDISEYTEDRELY